ADVESGARPAHVGRAAEPRLDPRVAEAAIGHPAGNAHAGVLARLPEVVLPAAERRWRGADPRDSRSPAHLPRRTEPQGRRGEGGEQQLGRTVTTAAALRYIERHGIVLEAGRGPAPALSAQVLGARQTGNWWAHPNAKAFFALTRAVRDDPDVLVCKL